MPRVTREHSAARRQQIFDAARTCFLRDGFHQASMQDIQREAGLSAGVIYLYFKSKNEIILGIANQILATIGGIIPERPVIDGEVLNLPDIIRMFLGAAEELHREGEIFPLAIQIWAEAVRDPVMLASLRESIADVKRHVRRLLEDCQTRGLVQADADLDGLTMAIIGLGQGFIVQRTLLGESARSPYLAGIDALLANVTAA
jgi:AcrR family transcriptional regulator